MKPGMVLGNELSVLAGFFLASKGVVNLPLLCLIFIGSFLVMASGCVFNNILDQSIDKKMERTKKRVLVTGLISGRAAALYATVLGIFGFLILTIFTNPLTVAIGFLGIISYVILYGIAKRRSVHGTLIGAFSGAIPPVAGYTAVSGRLDGGALLLFLILLLWQMPHFYAIAVYRLKDYVTAGIPVLPSRKGIQTAKIHIVLYIGAFLLAALSFGALGYTGKGYLYTMSLLGILWLGFGVQGFRVEDARRWSRKMFFLSLVVLLGFCTVTIVGSLQSGPVL